MTYTANVGVGSPAKDYTLLIDTGSSNTWIGARKAYVKTSTSVDTGKTISVTYGSGSFSGTECKFFIYLFVYTVRSTCSVDTDTVTLSSALVITQQGIGVASTSRGFQGVDGILGYANL